MPSNISPIDMIVITFFLILTIFIGLRAAKKVHNTTDYAIGGKSYGTFAILATLSASYIGGGYTFGVSEKTFSYGIIYIIALLGFSLQQLIVALYVAPKMSRFEDAISVGDIMHQLYGKHARTITAIASFIVCSGIIGAQVNAMGYVFYLFLGIPTTYGIIFGTTIVVAYAAIGGMRSVVATDILQFMILIVMLPLTFVLSVIKIFEADVSQVTAQLEPFHYSFTNEMGIVFFISIFCSLLFGEALVPPYIQRLLIGKTIQQTIRGTLVSAIISVPFFITVGLLGVVAYFYAPELNPNLALPHVINILLPVGLKGLAIAAMISVIMSSADSYLNASSVALIHDFYKPLFKPNLSAAHELKGMKLTTLIVGIMATFFALRLESVLDILLYSYNFWAPIILMPLTLGIVKNYKLTSNQFITLTAMTAAFMLIWNFGIEDHLNFEGLVAGTFFNLTLYMGMVKIKCFKF